MKTSQKKFWETLAKRAARGWKFKFEWSSTVREKRTNHCPVTAVCAELAGKKYEPHRYDIAAADIGLDIDFAKMVAAVADYREADDYSYDGRNLNPEDFRRMRKKLLKTLGLEEK